MGLGTLAPVNVIIPARMGSTRLPGKPLADVAGKPLIIRVLEGASTFPGARVWAATDSPEVAREVERHGYRALITGEACSGTRRVHMAWEALGRPPGVIVNLQGDEPLVNGEWIAALTALPDPRSVVTLAVPGEASDAGDPSAVKVVRGHDGRALYFSRSPVPWGDGGLLRHVGAYGFTPESLCACADAGETPLSRRERLEQLAWLESGIPIRVVAGNWPSLGVDTPEDLERARRRFLEA